MGMVQKEIQHPVGKKRAWLAIFLAALTFLALFLTVTFLNRHAMPALEAPLFVDGKEASFPYIRRAASGETVTYTIPSLPEKKEANPVIIFHTDNTFWEVKSDGRPISSFSERDVKKGFTVGRRWNMVFIPPSDAGKTLTISFHVADCVKAANLPEKIYYSGYRDMMDIFSSRFIPALITIIAIGVLSSIYIILSETILARMGENHILSGLGMSGLTMAIWMLAQNETTGFIFGYSYKLIAADYMSYINMQGLLLQAFILYATANMEKSWPFRWFEALLPVPYIIISVIMYNLDLYRILPFETSVLVSTIGLVVMIIVMLAISLYKLVSRKQRLTLLDVLLYYGTTLMIISAVTDQVLDRFFNSVDHSGYTRLSALIFLITVGSYEIYSFFMYWREAQEARVESKLAYVDGLTGIANRMAFNDAFTRLQESPVSAAVVSLDVNRLKGTNDTYGHIEGDKLIRIAASSIKEAFEDIGTAYRYGGDEFMVLIPNYSHAGVERACNKLEAIERRVNADGVLPDGISIAYGGARYDAAKDHTLEDTMRRADSAMYAAKKRQEGRE